MKTQLFDFYNSANLKAYNLNEIMRYQLGALDNMDPFTRLHSESVANLVCRICEYKGYNYKAIIHATMNAYLHDIGKLAIPQSILNKPTKLTDEEYKIIKTHTSKGYQMCMKDLKLRPYGIATLYHHEALDGTGYPNGLTKKNIPYIGQLVRVADEYDAITSKRQYKTHIDISQTLQVLIEEAKPTHTKKIIALNHLKSEQRLGKIDAATLRILFRVVIDDVYYEIASTEDYVGYLKGEIKRLETINKYYEKMMKSKREKEKNYFANGVKMLLQEGETIDNFKTVTQEYFDAVDAKREAIKKLYDEIKIIKRLKV